MSSLIVLKCIIQDSPFLVINLYNSNNEGEQVKILKRISEVIESIDPDHTSTIIMGGDFNFIQDINLDSDGGSPSLNILQLVLLLNFKIQEI